MTLRDLKKTQQSIVYLLNKKNKTSNYHKMYNYNTFVLINQGLFPNLKPDTQNSQVVKCKYMSSSWPVKASSK